MKIRDAVLGDVDEIFKHGQNIKEFSVNDATVNFWPKTTLKKAIANNDTLIFIAEENGQLIGFIIASYNQGLGKATIENIYVGSDYRNKGTGRELLKELLTALQHKGCKYIATLVPAHTDAVGFYKQAGFSLGKEFVWLDKALQEDFKRGVT